MRFDRVVFAGSVVKRQHDWQHLLEPRDGAARSQVTQVLNYVATRDWVVAIFPHGLERLGLQDLGGAGHLGFLTTTPDHAVVNVKHVRGGHSAGLDMRLWDEMAEFVLRGSVPPSARAEPQDATVVWAGRLAPAVWFLLASIFVGIGVVPLVYIGWPGWILAILFAFYLWLLRLLLTKA